MLLTLVRHGESEGNASGVHQPSSVGLSERGRQEARAVAQRLSGEAFDTIVSSPFARALQTAEIIGQTLHQPIVQSTLFVEIKRPTEIEGLPMAAAEVVAIKDRILDNWHDAAWRHSDEETFFDLRSRAIEALEFIDRQRVEHLLIVTHGEFMRMLMCVMVLGDGLQPQIFKPWRAFLSTSNTAITRCEYRHGEWRLIIWNDHIHLAEQRSSK
jgi:broad specificity phosphatase PhoE